VLEHAGKLTPSAPAETGFSPLELSFEEFEGAAGTCVGACAGFHKAVRTVMQSIRVGLRFHMCCILA